jgi:hypothetical protein
MKLSIAERLDSYSIPEPNSGCLLWCAAVSKKGYGMLKADGTMKYAHVLKWQQKHGPVPDGLRVLHKCDVRSCIEDSHLFLGTIAENNKDCASKGRTARGEKHGHSKLTAAQVRLIKNDKRKRAEIADEYGIHITHVSRIRHGARWAHAGA